MCRSHVKGSKKKRSCETDEEVQDQVSVFAEQEIQQELKKSPKWKTVVRKLAFANVAQTR